MAVVISQGIRSFEFQRTVEQFWMGVDLTLVEVFNASPDLGRDYRRELETFSEEEQLIAYHATPLQVAADLTLTRNPTIEQVRVYEKLVAPRFRHRHNSASENVAEFKFTLESMQDIFPERVAKRRTFLNRTLRAVRRIMQKL